MQLKQYLRGLDQTALVRLFELRPDVLIEPAPRHWDALAKTLTTRASLSRALHTLDRDTLTVTQALQVLGPGATRAALTTLLSPPGAPAPDALLERALRRLAELALAWPTPDGTITCPPRLASWWSDPLGLGAPAADLLAACPLAELRELAARHDLPATGTRADLTQRLTDRLGDREHLRRLLDGLPGAARAALTTRARVDLAEEDTAAELAVLVRHGILLRRGKTAAELPRETGLALGAHHPRARLTGPPALTPPAPTPTTPAALTPTAPGPSASTPTASTQAADLAESQAAVAVAEAVRLTTTLLENAEAEPIPALLTGGVGTREQRRLARAFACSPEQAALWLDLSYTAGLLGHHRPDHHHVDSYAPTAAYDTWRTRPAALRWTTLARTWLTLREAPTHRQTPDGRPVPPTVANPGPALAQRQALLATYAELPPGRPAPESAALAQLAWRLPLRTGTEHDLALARATLAEARLLGILAEDQLTSAGRALLAAHPAVSATPTEATRTEPSPTESAPTESAPTESAPTESAPAQTAPAQAAPAEPALTEAELVEAVAAMFPATADTVRLQSDLTAIVAGDPAQHLVRLLDSAADLETNSAARVWRFGPASVRRVLDAGRTAEDLLRELRALAPAGVPQPLEYLIRDVARRHGSTRVLDAGCVIQTADEVQAVEIMNSRPAGRLGLRQVAGTVLVSPRPRAETLAQLRRAGFTPVGEDLTGAEVPEDQAPRRGRAQPARWRPEDHTTTPGALAAVLATADEEESGTPDPVWLALADPEAWLRSQAPELPAQDRGLLAEAISSGAPVEIGYRGPEGLPGPRVVSELALDSGTLLAWCHRHEAEARFQLARITQARPAPPDDRDRLMAAARRNR